LKRKKSVEVQKTRVEKKEKRGEKKRKVIERGYSKNRVKAGGERERNCSGGIIG